MFIKTLYNVYKNSFDINSNYLMDSAESNRISVLVVSSLLLLSDIIDLLLLFIVHHAHLHEQLHYLIYLSIYTPYNLFVFLYARHTKNSKYFAKTVSIYLLLFVGLSASVFNFYFMDSAHNGFLTYYISGFLFLIVFSFSPFIFLAELLVALVILAPGVYKTFGFLSMLDSIIVTIVLFALSIYKRGVEKKFLLLLNKQKKSLEAKTFGNFTLLYDNKVIKFSRSKSPEFLAYLIYKNGSSVKTKELVSVLYGDNADPTRSSANLRNLVVDIKHTLSELEIQNFFVKEYNNFRINPEAIKCDYYDFLAGDANAIKSFAGEFMSQYDWAEEVTGFLETKLRSQTEFASQTSQGQARG